MIFLLMVKEILQDGPRNRLQGLALFCFNTESLIQVSQSVHSEASSL